MMQAEGSSGVKKKDDKDKVRENSSYDQIGKDHAYL